VFTIHQNQCSRWPESVFKILRRAHSKQKQESMTTWYESRVHIAVLERGLLEIHNLSDTSHFRVIPVIFPYLASDNPDRWQIVYKIIEHEVSKMGFDSLNLASDFKRVGFEKVQLTKISRDGKRYNDSLHLNELGYDLAAKRISEYLRSKFEPPK
jgi:hypothetical protein